MLNKFFKKITNQFKLQASIDVISENTVIGWVIDINNTTSSLVEAYYGGTLVGSTKAGMQRPDVFLAGYASENCGFEMHLDEKLDFKLERIDFFINGRKCPSFTNLFRDKLKETNNVVSDGRSISVDHQHDDYVQLINDRDWLIKMRNEELAELKFLRKVKDKYIDLLSEQPFERIETYLRDFYYLSDKHDFESLMNSSIPYEAKKSGFEYICSNILKRDLELGLTHLEFKVVEEPKVSIILILYNKAELTYQCLLSLLRMQEQAFELIVIDNASSDKSEELMKNIKGIKYIRNEENLGFLKAVNQARTHVKSKYIMLLNNDAIVKDRTLENALSVFNDEENVGVVGGKILHLDGLQQEAGSIIWNDASCLGYGRRADPSLPQYNYRREVDYVSGALFFVPTIIWDQLNGFDERLEPCYYEETDFCIRVHNLGLKVIYEPNCEITHFEFGSSSFSDFAEKQMVKNRLVIQELHKEYLGNQYAPYEANIELAAHASKQKNILYMDDQIPFDTLGGGFPRARQVINELKKHGKVFLYPFCKNNMLGNLDEYLDVYIFDHEPNKAWASISKLLEKIDLVWISRPHNMEKLLSRGWLEIFKSNNIPIVYDAEALFSERERIKAKIQDKTFNDSLIKNEKLLMSNADIITAVNETEKVKISESCKLPTYVVGHPCAINSVITHTHSHEVLFVGNLTGAAQDSPNVDSIDFFIENYYEQLVELGLTLRLVGCIDEVNRKRWQRKGVYIEGAVENIELYFKQAICTIAPTRFAAGIPHKVHESLSRGVPILASELIMQQCNFFCKEEFGLLSAETLKGIFDSYQSIYAYQINAAQDDMSTDVFINNINTIVDSLAYFKGDKK